MCEQSAAEHTLVSSYIRSFRMRVIGCFYLKHRKGQPVRSRQRKAGSSGCRWRDNKGSRRQFIKKWACVGIDTPVALLKMHRRKTIKNNMESNNPMFSGRVLNRVGTAEGGAMTMNGFVNRLGILLVLLLVAGGFTWNIATQEPGTAGALLIGGCIVGFGLAIVTAFVPKISPFTSPVYAIAEGLLLGAISAILEQRFKGIVLTAALLTVTTVFGMLALYKFRILRATQGFVKGVMIATVGVALTYLLSMILNAFGVSVPYIHGNGIIGIGFSAVVLGIAALNLILDFDLVENSIVARAPKYMEWFAAFSLLITIVWIYMELLRLLSKLRSRN